MRHARRAHSLVPNSPAALTNVGVTAFYASNLSEARAWCGKAAALMPAFVPPHHCVASVDAESAGGEPATPDPLLLPAVRFAKTGNFDGALDWLQIAADRHSDSLIFMGVQPAFGPLQADPRYQSVLERAGLKRVSNLTD